MHKILVTGIGGDIAQSISKIIRNSNLPVQLIGTDVNKSIPWGSFVDEFYKVPFANDTSYLSALENIIVKEWINVLIPTTEQEIRVINNAKVNENWNPTRILIAPSHIVNIFLDKLETIRFLAANNIPVPGTEESEREPESYPCILKHRFGSGSKGLTIIEDEQDLKYFRSKRKGWILQELLSPDDEEYTCGVYTNDGQNMYVIVLKRVLKDSVTGMAEVVYDKEIIKLCERIGSLIDLKGSINIQLRKTSQGPMIFEVNPRFSSTAIFRDHLGFRDVIWSIMDVLTIQHKIQFNYKEIIGRKFYRIYSEVFTES